MRKILLAAAATLALSSAAQAAFMVTYEAPGGFNSTATFDFRGVENFSARNSGSFNTDFGTTGQGTVITGTYSNVQIMGADQYGGANNDNYVAATGSNAYSLSLSAQSNGTATAVTYFGYWLSALDAGNRLEISRNGTTVFTFNPSDVLASLGTCPSLYCGNPVAGANQGQNAGEPYAFVNFFDQSGLGFDTVRFFESPAVGNYESDNHTVGFYRTITGTPVNVPEPVSLALFGMGLLGMGLTRRRKANQVG